MHTIWSHLLDISEKVCGNVTISLDSGDIGDPGDTGYYERKYAMGFYVPVGVWDGGDKPIYYKKQGYSDKAGYDPAGPYFLYWGTDGWFVGVIFEPLIKAFGSLIGNISDRLICNIKIKLL